MPLGTSDRIDADPDRYAACATQLRSFGGRGAVSGPVRTVRCRDDNALVRELLTSPGGGGVLVVDGGGWLGSALVGDVLAGLAVENHWAGIVVNGAVRDVVALGGVDLLVLALGTCPRRAARTGAGERDVPVTFGGARFVPGALLHADADGIVVARHLSATQD